MAEVLGLASSIAGLITLAQVVIDKTWKIAIRCKNASKDAQRLLNQMQTLLGVLKSLEILHESVDETSLQSRIPMTEVYRCQTTLERLRVKLPDVSPKEASSLVRKIERTVKWPFTVSEIEQAMEELEQYKTSFNLTVSMDTLEAVLQVSKDQYEMAKDIKEICGILETKERRETLAFFGTSDSLSNHEMGLHLHQAGTGLWLTEGPEFQQWKQKKNSKLWLYGIPGAGKTILASVVISKVLNATENSLGDAVAYYYCDYKKPASRELQNVLASIVGQLARQNERCFQLLEKCYRSLLDKHARAELPSRSKLTNLIWEMSTHYQNVAIVVDAVDESVEPDELSSALSSLVTMDESNIKMVLLSRNEQNIRDQLGSFEQISIAARSSDLKLYAAAQLEERSKKRHLRIQSSALKEEIMDRLVNGADGM